MAVAAWRAHLPSAERMATAREAGWQDAIANRPRADEHASYLDKTSAERALTMAYNHGYTNGMQQALQDRYGNPPD